MLVQVLISHRRKYHELFHNSSRARKHYLDHADTTRGNDRFDGLCHYSSDLCVHVHPGMFKIPFKNETD